MTTASWANYMQLSLATFMYCFGFLAMGILLTKKRMNGNNCVKRKTTLILLTALISSLGIPISSHGNEPFLSGRQEKAHVQIELIAEGSSIQPGTSMTIAVRFILDPHWHIYWKNPGSDTGLATMIQWILPPGFAIGDLQWPKPELIKSKGIEGTVINYGYNDEVLLLAQLQIPKTLKIGGKPNIRARVNWLVCNDEKSPEPPVCIPGEIQLELLLPVVLHPSDKPIPEKRQFSEARKAVPKAIESEWEVYADKKKDRFYLQVIPPTSLEEELTAVRFFPYQNRVIDDNANQYLQKEENFYLLSIPPKKKGLTIKRLEGVLVYRGKNSQHAAVQIDVPLNGLQNVDSEQLTKIIPDNSSRKLTIWRAIVLALFGGLILNVMPCVFPVISLKVMDFVHQAGGDPSKVWKHGVIFTLGVLISFWILAGIFLMFRAGGEELGWGFQLQEPGFVIALSVFLFIFALNLFGVFEIGSSLSGLGSMGTGRNGYSSSFITGITATLVATPCTAPFMAPALGFAATQSSTNAMLIFTALGFGMTLPYLLLSLEPRLLQFLPKPGAWMETFKQFMGFLLMLTVVWLLSILINLSNSTTVLLTMIGLLIIAIACWALGRWATPVHKKGTRIRTRMIALCLIVSGIALPFYQPKDYIEWQEFSPQKLESLLTENQPVFIDFTADWCLTCKINERRALNRKEVAKKMRDLKIIPLKADWTKPDEHIGQILRRYGSVGVPFYLLYTGNEKEPLILPQLLTSKIVLDALDKVIRQDSDGKE